MSSSICTRISSSSQDDNTSDWESLSVSFPELDTSLSETPFSDRSSSPLEYVVNQVFFTPYHPQSDDHTGGSDLALASAVHAAARIYDEYIDHAYKPHWSSVTRMLEDLRVLVECRCKEPGKLRDNTISQLREMEVGDMLAFALPHDKDGLIFWKQGDCTLCELFSMSRFSRMECCSYLERAIKVPNQVFDAPDFRSALADSLSHSSSFEITDMLRRSGHPVKPKLPTRLLGSSVINKRDGPDWGSRSPLWFLIKVTVQLFLDRSPLGHTSYKVFMLFFMCNLANNAVNTSISGVLLHSMSAKILRRFRKLDSSTPQWLSDTVSCTCTSLSRSLDQRWREVQYTQSVFRSPAPWDSSHLDLTKDIQFSLSHIHEYISVPVTNRGPNPRQTSSLLKSHLQGTLNDFLSDPAKVLHDDIHITLYDIERAVGEEIDDWIASVADTDGACEQLEHLAHRYWLLPQSTPSDPEHLSSMLLTIIELWVALDKLVVQKIPLLADYSPEVPLGLLCHLLLHDPARNHRWCRVYRYLSSRHTRAHPGWSALSDEFAEHSFPCRYYDSSQQLQHLKSRIGHMLPSIPLHAKVVVFELLCPMSLHAWRSVTCWISGIRRKYIAPSIRVCDIPELKPHVSVKHSCSLHLSLFGNRLYYVCDSSLPDYSRLAYRLPSGPFANSGLQEYLDNTTHTSNEVLVAQANCSPNLSLHEFVAFAHLRSGGSLQWFNILRELRSRNLNFRHQEVYLLLTQASAQVGPLDDTGQLSWHQELQDASFCHALLDELESLFIDLEVGSSDGPAMATISLLAGILVSRTSQDIFKRAARLLRNVRYKTFEWVRELVYNVRQSPTDKQSFELLRDMAAVCRSTFDVGSTTSHKLLRSAQDIEIALACAMVIRTATLLGVPAYAGVLLNRNHRLSLILEGCLRDAIQADASNVGVDRAVQLVWPGYRPSPRRWEPLQSPNSRWLVCKTAPTCDRPSQMVHINLLDGSLLVDGKPMDSKLPGEITKHSMYYELFGGRTLVVVASDLPGMDYVAMSGIHKHHVHFAVRDGSSTFRGIHSVPNEQDMSEEASYKHVPVQPQSSSSPRVGLRRPRKLNLKTAFSRGPGSLTKPRKPLLAHRALVRPPYSNDYLAFDPCNVIIRAQSKDTDDVFELIPREILQGDLPRSLVERHLHWLNPSKSIIEIRPIEEPWKQSSDNWTIHLSPGQSHVTKGGELLVNRESTAWTMITSHFLRLDNPENFVVTMSPTGTKQSSSLRLSVTLPRYNLSFFVNEDGNLESRDFKDMVYDEDQCVGTLFGLINRLVLRPKAQIEADSFPKLLLIPHSDFLYLRNHNVSVELPSFGPVNYYMYQVDSELGCLKGISNLESRLYLARLHFFTGLGCRPDLLTGRTGVEEAISLVWLAGTREGAYRWSTGSQSPQIRVAFAKIQPDCTNTRWKPPTADALLREALLFPSEVAPYVQPSRKGPLASLDQLLRERSVPRLPRRNRLPHQNFECHELSPSNIDPLRQLFSSLQTNEPVPRFQSQYISRLHHSVRCFQTTHPFSITCQGESWRPGIGTLREHYAQCRINYKEGLDTVKMALGPSTEFERILDECGQWPRVTPFVLFRCLASTSSIKPPESWKECITSLALLALDLQRARRLLRFALDNLEEELYKELENEGCDGWDPATHPDWLLIQLQGNFLIRRVQADVAKEMMFPRLGKNTVVQVNMGEGKSSVIIPICAATLSDGHQLVRIIVPKALIPQTLHLLTDRLNGLVDKPIYHLTFSRNDITATSKLKHLANLLTKHRDEGGIVVMQPEDILSFKLACLEVQLLKNGIGIKPTPIFQKRGFENGLHLPKRSLLKSLTKNTYVSTVVRAVRRWRRQSGASEVLTDLQRFLETNARDILDESDDVLRPQLRLIYTIGYQRPFEGSPDRWVVLQQVLGFVKRHAYLLSTPDSHIFQCEHYSPVSFPSVNILETEGGEQLLSLIAQDVLDGHLSNLKFHSEPELKGAIGEFILRRDIHSDIVRIVENYARQSTSWGSLLLLRGLLAHGILLFALTQRRWRVDYGLDPASPPRTMLAIPYRAKDVPAKTAEFSHPDMTILLTCLSYYYGGLSEKQLRNSFELLLQQDDPSFDYSLWLEDCDITSVPYTLRKLSGVNIKSWQQWVEYLVPLFTRNKRAIDLYLSKIVFPKYATEFDQRISGSYWDIAEEKNYLVTGFSGTNDGQYLLPTSIVQDDPDHLHQTGTNAMVLSCLLQPENSSYMVTSDKSTTVRWTTSKFLEMVVSQEPPIRVLLDVGAQILDLSNLQLANTWLDSTPDIEIAGAIYFSEDDKLMVLTRNGTTQSLSSSPLNGQLHRCVAYLDHAHTRGVDLDFPRGFRAAITLGHKVTKDRLVQGCMRMRKLGHGHSVMFFAPREVDKRIRSLVSKTSHNTPVTIVDILRWAVHETWSDIQRLAPYWAQQGMSHQARHEAWSRFCRNEATPEKLADAWVRPEFNTLVDMYMPCSSAGATSSAELPPYIRERCKDLGVLSLRDVRMDEEQEREMSREIEREREGKRRNVNPSPARHLLHPKVINFVRTGDIPSPFGIRSRAFRQVFATGVTAASSGQLPWSPYILATADFCRTIEKSREVDWRIDDYLRPVQWVLSGKMSGRDALVLLSPFEADQLMPEIRISEHVHLHLYIPRTTKRMKPSDDLRLYSVPPLSSDWTPPWTLIDQLNLFAGQLYLSDHPSYVRLCQLLGIHTEELSRKAGTVVARNWFSNHGSSGADVKYRFKGTPLLHVMRLLATRRGMNFLGTHMGRILDGWPLTEKDFQSSAFLMIDSAE